MLLYFEARKRENTVFVDFKAKKEESVKFFKFLQKMEESLYYDLSYGSACIELDGIGKTRFKSIDATLMVDFEKEEGIELFLGDTLPYIINTCTFPDIEYEMIECDLEYRVGL